MTAVRKPQDLSRVGAHGRPGLAHEEQREPSHHLLLDTFGVGVLSWFPQKSDGFTSRTTGVQHLPVNKCGNLIGKMTASLRASLAPSSPATSFHRMLGFSITTAPAEGGKAFNLEPRPTRGPSTHVTPVAVGPQASYPSVVPAISFSLDYPLRCHYHCWERRQKMIS